MLSEVRTTVGRVLAQPAVLDINGLVVGLYGFHIRVLLDRLFFVRAAQAQPQSSGNERHNTNDRQTYNNRSNYLSCAHDTEYMRCPEAIQCSY